MQIPQSTEMSKEKYIPPEKQQQIISESVIIINI